jgi:molybdopterin-guanine dinucleotide biosynthesis protein A
VAKIFNKHDITAIILAGGRGSRMGGTDKGLQNFNGTPMALHALMRVGGQVGYSMINANRNLSAYESFGADVWPDGNDEFAGPLSGFVVGLERCETPYLLTVPCDTPFLPHDLASRLWHGLQADTDDTEADIAMAAQAGHTQPVFCLIKHEMLESLLMFMKRGGRKIDAWTATQKTVIVNFDDANDDPKAFANANTIAELAALEQTT